MWIIAGAKTKVRPVRGGRHVERRCSTCKTSVVFQECDVLDTLTAFFVPLFDHTSRRLVCMQCGEDHDLDAPPSAAPARIAPAAAPARRPVTDKEIDAELAALKRRMARDEKKR